MHISLDDEHIQAAIEALYWSINSELDDFPLNKDNILLSDDIDARLLLGGIETLKLKLETLERILLQQAQGRSPIKEGEEKELQRKTSYDQRLNNIDQISYEIQEVGGVINLTLWAGGVQKCIEALINFSHAQIAEDIANQITGSLDSYMHPYDALVDVGRTIRDRGGQYRIDLNSEDVFLLIQSLIDSNRLTVAEIIIEQCPTRAGLKR